MAATYENMPVLAPGNGQTKTGRLWVYVRDNRRSGSTAPAAAWFAYTPNRQGLHPQGHLANFSGVLQADAYAGYDQVYADGCVREAACMAHARRKIHDLHVRKATVTTTKALRRIGELYAIEEQIRGLPPDERKRIRQEQARPLLDDMERWLSGRLLALSTQSDTTKAINYMLNQWQALVYYCGDGLAIRRFIVEIADLEKQGRAFPDDLWDMAVQYALIQDAAEIAAQDRRKGKNSGKKGNWEADL